eukprot:1160594-Pelagomonas_calceolata.AAC.4
MQDVEKRKPMQVANGQQRSLRKGPKSPPVFLSLTSKAEPKTSCAIRATVHPLGHTSRIPPKSLKVDAIYTKLKQQSSGHQQALG